METNLDVLRSADFETRTVRHPVNRMRVIVAMLAVAAVVAFSIRYTGPIGASSAGSVAYCVTELGDPAAAGLNTALYTLGSSSIELYATGETDYNGCGVFNFVPVDEAYFISAWSEGGTKVGNSSWFASDAMTVAPNVELTLETSASGVWLQVFEAQAYDHVQ